MNEVQQYGRGLDGPLDAVQITRQLVTLKDQIAPGASLDELAYFGQVCSRLGLSPFADQIVLIGRWDNRLGRQVFRHQITVAGRRSLAVRTGELVGIEGPEWCGPRPLGPPRRDDAGKVIVDEQGNPVRERGPLEWTEVWDRPEPPYCARVLVHRKGWIRPSNGTAKWSEFAQTDKHGKLIGLWPTMAAHMLGKVAESIALRRAFPDVISDDIAGAYVAVEDYADLIEADQSSASSPVRGEVDPPSTDRPEPALLDELEERVAALDDWTRTKLREWWTTDPPLPKLRDLNVDELDTVNEWIDAPPANPETVDNLDDDPTDLDRIDDPEGRLI